MVQISSVGFLPLSVGTKYFGLGQPGQKFALVDEEWKYLHGKESDDELYSLKDDPHELRNVIAAHPAVASSMLAEIEKFAARDTRPLNQRTKIRTKRMHKERRERRREEERKAEREEQQAPDPEAAVEDEADKRLLDELRALGYVD